MTGQLYPNLAATAARTDNEIALAISIYGPGAKGPHNLSRKIIKNATYRNWRLNGEFIFGPPDDPSRYDNIQPGDLAIMSFRGETSPNGMELIIVSQTSISDIDLHIALTPFFDNKSMIAVTPTQIINAASSASVPGTHPVYIVAADPELESALEDAAQGGLSGTKSLLKNRATRRISASDFAKAKAKAEQIGQNGEGLINGHLATQLAAGNLAGYKWASAENAVEPFDFETVTPAGLRTLIDVKATSGPFQNIIHLSLAEIIEASGPVPYRLFRISELDDDGGRLRVSEEINSLAAKLKKLHEEHMPAGIRVDSFSVATSAIKWSADEYIERLE